MKSRWQTQLEALGMAPSSAEGAKEKSTFERLTLPELVLPEARPLQRPRTGRWIAAAGGLMILALAFVFIERVPEDLRMKGRPQSTVWWERAGVIQPLADGVELAEGDRVRAEVQSPKAATAYWLVHDAELKPLVDAAFVLASALPLEAGKAGAFAQSMKIVGPAAGETLVILVCGQPLDAVTAEKLLARDAPKGCYMQSFTLRSASPGKQ